MAIYPTPQQIQQLAAGPADGPVVMVNLLRFKPRADAPDDGLTGEEAYQRYADRMIPFVVSKGCRVIGSGHVQSQVIGDGGEGFHAVALVEYPSRRAFVEIARDPRVQEFGVHREAGLECQWLLAASEMPR